MANLNAIAKDIALETNKQGEKVKRLDEHITNAAENTKAGLGELKEAEVHQKKGQKCLIIILLVVLAILAVVVGLIIWKVTKWSPIS